MLKRHILSLRRSIPWLTILLLPTCPAFFTGCARPPADHPAEVALYQAPAPASVSPAYAPAYLIGESSAPFNKIGTPAAREGVDNDPEIFVDPEKPSVYYETRQFSTAKGRYTNLIYRIHFREVPLDWGKINLTAGRNPGILVIYTLDEKADLLLVTTVHTCGCFLAFLPTTALPPEAFPPDWPAHSQWIYGYTLPSRLSLPREETDDRIVFTLASETHRIRDVAVAAGDARQTIPDRREMILSPMQALYSLPYRDGTVSFFETAGCRKGYVKNNTKILERLLISWWAFDLHVGQDKAYSVHDGSDTVFYTSLKFWARQSSDLKDFPGFLAYWGWKL